MKLSVVGCAGSLIYLLTALQLSSADVVFDGSTGTAGAVAGPNFLIDEADGTRIGGNLLHSFERFNVGVGESATFTGAADINAVISRVTGGAVSQINGFVVSTLPNADFWFFNPAGLAIGAGGFFNVPAALHLSTADEVIGADGSTFAADVASNGTLLAADPVAFGFIGNNPGSLNITNTGAFLLPSQTLTLAGGTVALNAAALRSPNGIVNLAAAVPSDSSGALRFDVASGVWTSTNGEMPSGGAVTIENGSVVDTIGTGGSQIRIAAGDILLSQSALLNSGAPVSESTGGVFISGDRFTLTDQAVIRNNTFGTGTAGVTEISAGTIRIANGGGLFTGTVFTGDGGNVNLTGQSLVIDGEDNGPQTGLFVNSSFDATGASGNVNIDVATLDIRGGGQIDAQAFGPGNAGRIVITAEMLTAQENARIRADSGQGTGGRVTLVVNELALLSGAQVSASNAANAGIAGGSIDVTATGDVTIEGLNAEGTFRSGLFNDALAGGDAGNISLSAPRLRLSGGRITTDTVGTGNAGNVFISGLNAETPIQISLENAAQVFSGTSATGDGGGIRIDNAGQIDIRGTSNAAMATPDIVGNPTGIFSNVKAGATGSGGLLQISADGLTLTEGGAISAQTAGSGPAGAIILTLQGDLLLDNAALDSAVVEGTGDPADLSTSAGAISIRADRLFLRNGAVIVSRSLRGPGSAGTITVTAPNQVDLNAGSITSLSRFGGGGQITVTSDGIIRLAESARIESSVQGGSDTTAGNIAVEGRFLVLDSSTILANAAAGSGGQIAITVDQLFQDALSTIDASAETGIDGEIVIDAPDETISGELVILDGQLVDASALLAGRCGADTGSTAVKFSGALRGGVAPSPDTVQFAGWQDTDVNAAGRDAVRQMKFQPAYRIACQSLPAPATMTQ